MRLLRSLVRQMIRNMFESIDDSNKPVLSPSLRGRYKTAISCINVEHGIPCLYINRERQEGLAYLTYLPPNNCYADFAAAGYRLYSLPVFFGFNHLNAHQITRIFKGDELIIEVIE